MSTTITIELSAEDRARLDAILEALKPNNGQIGGSIDPLVQTRSAVKEAPELPQKPTEEPSQPVTPRQEEKPTETAPEPPADAPKQEAPKVGRADVQRLVVELSAAGKKAEVKEIVMAYADRVSAIPEDKLAEVCEKLSKLGGR